MKEYLECNKCKHKIQISKQVRNNLNYGLSYICKCGGKYK